MNDHVQRKKARTAKRVATKACTPKSKQEQVAERALTKQLVKGRQQVRQRALRAVNPRDAVPDLVLQEMISNVRDDLIHPEWALIIGGSQSVWDDVLAFEKLYGKPWDGIVIAANDIGCHWPRFLDHWCTLHPSKMPGWVEQREANGFSDGFITWGRRRYDLDVQIRPWAGGASGMLAVQIASRMYCSRAILCGIPMDTSPHFAESVIHNSDERWKSAPTHWRAWTRHLDKTAGWVRSMGGNTAKVLGVPTMEWLHAVSNSENKEK